MNHFSCQIKKANSFLALSTVGIILLPSKIFADVDDIKVPVADPDSFDLDAMFQSIRNYFFGFIIITCVFMVLWGGFDLATSGGDETKVSNAKKRVLYATIGLVVAALASVIVSLVRAIINV